MKYYFYDNSIANKDLFLARKKVFILGENRKNKNLIYNIKIKVDFKY